MMGLSPSEVVAAVEPLGVAALGANCGRSLDDTDSVVEEFLAASPTLRLWVKPNAGVPRIAEHVRAYADRGARIVGGCCGSTPEHIAAIARAVGRAR